MRPVPRSPPIAHRLAVRGPPRADPVTHYLQRLGASSADKQRVGLGCVAGLLTDGLLTERQLDWARLTYSDTLALRAALVARYAPATAQRLLCAVRGVLKECWRLRLMGHEDYCRAVDIPPVRGESLPAGRALDDDELRRLLAACRDGTVLGVRDLAVIALLAATGLRRHELSRLRLEDWDAATGRLRVRWGKGGRQRWAWIRDGTAVAALAAWFAARGSAPGALISRFTRGSADRLTVEPISGDMIAEIVERRARLAGIKHCTPHDLRRTFATRLVTATGDVRAVSRLLGHAKLETTQLYLRDGDELAEQAATRVNLPA